MSLKTLKNCLMSLIGLRIHRNKRTLRQLKEILISLEDSDDCLFDDTYWNIDRLVVRKDTPISYLSCYVSPYPFIWEMSSFDLYNTINRFNPNSYNPAYLKVRKHILTRRRKLKWKNRKNLSKRCLNTFA